MASLNQRVKGAVLTAPYLLNKIQLQSSTNQHIFNAAVRRLLPHRTSMEIEHMPMDLDLFNDNMNRYKLKEKYNDIYEYDVDGDIFSKTTDSVESKISIHNWQYLEPTYNILNILKEHTSIDDNGSLHIHVNLHDWYECVGLNDIQKNYRALGYVLLANSGSDEVCCFLNYILDKVGKIFGITLNESTFDYSVGYLKGINEFDSGKGNRRAIGFLNDHLYNIIDTTKYYGDYNTYLRKMSGQTDDNYAQRKKKGIPESSWKLNWINMRANPTTIEYRAGPCTFDYSEIISYCIECNRITKELLNFIDYIGERTIRTAVLP
jgi:hypothetical protein